MMGSVQTGTPTDVLGLVGSVRAELRFETCVSVGGLGTVYRGRHGGRGDLVAIRCLRLPVDADVNAIASMLREDTTRIGNLAHGNHDIARYLGSGTLEVPETGALAFFIASEWASGKTLQADLAERTRVGLGGRSLQETLDLLESAALALSHAHVHGVVHGDVRAANLVITKTRTGTSRLKVLDLGLVRMVDRVRVLLGAGGQDLHAALERIGRLSGRRTADGGENGASHDVRALAVLVREVGGEKPEPGSLPPPIDTFLGQAITRPLLDPSNHAGTFWSELRDLARRSAPHVADESALAATAFDGDVAAAILQVRAMTKPKDTAEPRSSVEGSPFTGTMLMTTSPQGALRQLAPSSPAAARPDQGPPPPHENNPTTAPLQLPVRPGLLVSPSAVTVGTAMPSPLASSFGPGTASPIAPVALRPLATAPRTALLKSSPIPEPARTPGPPNDAPTPSPAAPPAPPPHQEARPSSSHDGARASSPPLPLPLTRGPGHVVGALAALVVFALVVAACLWQLAR